MARIDDIPKTYDPQATAARVYDEWERSGAFAPRPDAPNGPFSIVIPPPNITGILHMGHALNNTLQDVLVRYKRMDGYDALWVPGTDHAGIATQWVVERELQKLGLDRRTMGRDAFVEKVWQWKDEAGGSITKQLRSLGVSCDWQHERFTMDEGLSKAVRETFVRYYEEGLIYRAERLINWDPVGMTALSDLEVEAEENYQTELWSFAYPLSAPSGGLTEIVVATTRPETMLGDTAIAVHPDDPRYAGLVGKTVRHPILDREIPIVGDAILVDMAFGTGAVKVTPAHDFNDFEVGKRHGLPFLTMFTPDGKVNDVGGPFAGLTREDARKAVKARLRELGLERGSKPHTMALPKSQRSGAVVEPMISTQWFLKMKPLAQPAMAAVERGFTRFVPEMWANTYFAWLREIKDWCISRQLWWGHQIPAWYCDQGHTTVSREDPTACSTCGSDKIERDEDVLDTWFSSALWPFSTLGWPDDTADLRRYYPTSVLVTGFDIIFFWVVRMVFSGQHFMGEVPFRDVYIHALVRDEEGEKMSKTKGNVVDPLVAIEKYGVDAFRMTLVAFAAQGRDVLWSEKRVEGYTKFNNKIWNAFRFAMMHLEAYDPAAPRTPGVYDTWILARLGEAVGRTRKALDDYKFNEAANEIYQFTWTELCDWYLELSKGTLYDKEPENEPRRQAARHTLRAVFEALVRLFHPIMPFLSEEIWKQLGCEGTVMAAPYPRTDDFPSDPTALAEVAELQEVITAIRQVRSDMNIAMKKPLTIVTADTALLSRHPAALQSLAGVHGSTAGARPAGNVATAVVRGKELFLPLEIDVAAEKARIEKELVKANKELAFLDGRLANDRFVANAPPPLLEETRAKRALADEAVGNLEKALAALG
jgi:valyl-tRNA synthetase